MVMVMHCRTATCTFNYGTQKAVTSDLYIVVPDIGVGRFIQPNACVNIPCSSLPVVNWYMDITGFLKHFWIYHNGAVSKLPVIWKWFCLTKLRAYFLQILIQPISQNYIITQSDSFQKDIFCCTLNTNLIFHRLRAVCAKSVGIVNFVEYPNS
jgi:hypothetical protein